MKPEDVAAAARAYVGTPFKHQGRLRGVGIDCAGLVACVAFDLGHPQVSLPPYPRQPNPAQFREVLSQYMDEIPVDRAGVGDVFVFRFIAEQHLGILSGTDTMIHADSKHGKVLEISIARFWRSRVSSAWRYRWPHG